jgi:mandelate racemase
MSFETLTLKSIRARPVVLKLKRPIVARIATLADWPLILIDLYTEEGVIGRSYLEPYIRKSMRYLIPALHDLGEMFKGRRLAPIEFYEAARKSLLFVGYEGMAMITVAGVDMAAWDALARAADVPLCVLLGGCIGTVPAYNSNGLWLRSPEEVATEAVELREEGGFQGLKLRLGRERLAEDLATIEAVREALGTDLNLMVDFNQGLQFGEALERCHAIDHLGLAWIEEPIVYDNLEGYARLTADLKTPVQIGENFYGPRALYAALQMKACDYVMPDFMRIGGVTGWQRAAAIAAAAGVPVSTHLYPEVAAHVMRVTETTAGLCRPRRHRHQSDGAGAARLPRRTNGAPNVGLRGDDGSQVRRRLAAGGKRIRTHGPTPNGTEMGGRRHPPDHLARSLRLGPGCPS